MIKFLLGLAIGYIVVSVYGPEIVFTMWDGAVNEEYIINSGNIFIRC